MSFWFCNHLDGEDKAVCFTLIVFLMFCDSQCSVVLPNGTMGGLQCVIVVLLEHTRLIFCMDNTNLRFCSI